MSDRGEDLLGWAALLLFVCIMILISGCATPDMRQDEVNAIVEILK